MDSRRHTPVGRYRAPRLSQRNASGLSQIKTGRGRHLNDDVYGRDRDGAAPAQTFRLLLSTIIAATVTLAVTAVVVYGSLETREQAAFDIFREIERAQQPAEVMTVGARSDSGLNWIAPKQDRLQLATSAMTARHVLHEQVQIIRNGRPFLKIKPYLRVVARLAPAPREYSDVIPSFNPLKLYTSVRGRGRTKDETDNSGAGRVLATVSQTEQDELPVNDRQALAAFQVASLVAETIAADPPAPSVRFGIEQQLIDGLTPAYLSDPGALDGLTAPSVRLNVTSIERRAVASSGDGFNLERQEVRLIRPAVGDTVAKLLKRIGAPLWVADGMAATSQEAIGSTALRTSQQVHVVLAPSLDGTATVEPIKLIIFDEGHTHRVTVKRTATGEFIAQMNPDQDALIRAMTSDDGLGRNASLYAAIYAMGIRQQLAPAQIVRILKIHAPDTDFRRPVSAGDQLELFFELDNESDTELKARTLIYTALTTGGKTRSFWRFRSQDGTVDYFNSEGQNNRKFLLRKPVRGSNVRLTSGYGMRRHPILKRYRMHAGIDWAAPTGTPIIAAANGVVAEARRYRAYGNHVRLRHANGYETTYSHMHRYGPGVRPGVSVKQGQVIGYVGSTGLSTGPHLHFEVHVNDRVVNPLKIPTLRERTLKGRELRDYKRERARLLTILRSPPVRVAQKR
ncbi:MAG: M23 family metallopeptidase [Pseudomonadota bacterium]